MGHFEKYLSKSLSKADEIQINFSPEIIIVIPAFNEPFITNTLYSLLANDFKNKALVLIVVNYAEKANTAVKEFNQQLYKVLIDWCEKESTDKLKFDVLLVADMPRKHAGAGLARKVGMDTAIDIFFKNNQKNGIIASLDADCEVSGNYLSAIYHQFSQEPNPHVVLLDFFHQKKGLTHNQKKAIIQYEMYLHYFVLGCRLAGFPYAYHTIGSCFAVGAETYVRQGGMNKKHAGEDFYFLHKLFPLGKISRLYNARVYPSSRVSDRVPFGTGPALKKILTENTHYLVYDFRAFKDLQPFYEQIHKYYDDTTSIGEIIPPALKAYFIEIDFETKLKEAHTNSSSAAQFKKRLLRHFDAFQLVKYLNFAHEKEYYRKIAVEKAASKMIAAFGKVAAVEEEDLLCQLRDLEKITHPR